MAKSRRRRRIRGDRAFKRLIKRMGDATREEMVVMLDEGGEEILAAQRAAAPFRSGTVKNALSKRVLRGALQLKVGLVGRPLNRRLFYARIIEKGRKAKTVPASRGGAHLEAGGRRIGRKQRALASGTRGVYQMRIRALPPRPFIYSDRVKTLRETLGGRTRRFWERALRRASEGLSDQ